MIKGILAKKKKKKHWIGGPGAQGMVARRGGLRGRKYGMLNGIQRRFVEFLFFSFHTELSREGERKGRKFVSGVSCTHTRERCGRERESSGVACGSTHFIFFSPSKSPFFFMVVPTAAAEAAFAMRIPRLRYLLSTELNFKQRPRHLKFNLRWLPACLDYRKATGVRATGTHVVVSLEK